jgi:hypothetical protein
MPGAGQGVLHIELIVSVTGHIGEVKGLEAFRGRRPQAVVLAAWVADPEDEDPARDLSRAAG